jgi:hypothetical protein
MKKILDNLALIDLTAFCRAHGIKANGADGSGGRLKYDGRFKYSLVTVSNGKLIASVQFHKHQVPTHTVLHDLSSKSKAMSLDDAMVKIVRFKAARMEAM